MVHPYLKRRMGLEPVAYPSKALEAVLERTKGVPLFQEQAMQIAIVGAGFSPPEADKLRRAMATFRRVGTIKTLRDKFIQGMLSNGYTQDYAEACFKQIEGFGEYGFPESHAASFAILVYVSAWFKCHYPDIFAAALLNAQPMGFYAPAQIVRDAIEHGVDIRAPDVNSSDWDCTLEAAQSVPANGEGLAKRHLPMAGDIRATHAVRLGLREIKGAKQEDMERLAAGRGQGYDSIRDLWLRTNLSAAVLERLADADAFASLGFERRHALWAVKGLNRVGGHEDLPLLAHGADPAHEPDFALPPLPLGAEIIADYRALSLSLKGHPAAFLREALAARGAIRADDLARMKNGQRVRVAGLVLVRQRPGTASGVVFMTLEDETHIANIIVWPKTFERFRAQILAAKLCAVEGQVQSESGVIHVVAQRIWDWSALLDRLSEHGTAIDPTSRADEVRCPGRDARVQPNAAAVPEARNFH
jgi:error-prone DNA polymerase